ADRYLALPELPCRAGPEQQPVLVGILEKAAAATDHGGAGLRCHFLHLRPAALGHTGAARLYRSAGWFQLPYSAGSAGAIQSGIRFLAIDRGGTTYPDTGRDGWLVDASSGLSLIIRWATYCTADH